MTGRRTDLIAGAGLVVCWSSGFVGAQLGTRAAPVETVLAWRTLLAAVLLGGWALLRGDRVPRAELGRHVVLGLLVQVGYLAGVFAAAAAGVSAGTTALITALQPLLVVAVAGRVLGEATSRAQRAGFLVAGLGVALVVAGDLGGGTAPPAAHLLPVLAVLSLTAGTVLQQRWDPRGPVVAGLAVQCAVAAAVFAGAAGVRGGFRPPAEAGFWVAVGWLVVLSTLGGYGSYLVVVRRSGASRASALLYLTPPTTALWAWALQRDVPPLLALPGALVCALGVAASVRARPRQDVGDREVPVS